MAARSELLAFACILLLQSCQGLFSFDEGCKTLPEDHFSLRPNIQNATKVRLAQFSSVAFTVKGNQLPTWTCDLCRKNLSDFQLFKLVQDTQVETLAYTGYDPTLRAIVVVYRGTLTALNWLNNFRFASVESGIFPSAAGKVHKGFLHMYKSLRAGVLDDVNKLIALHPNAPIYLTGLSLGSAMTALGALDFKQDHPNKNPIVVSFGGPRVGDTCFVNYYNERITQSLRIINKGDLIVYLPPRLFGYRHVAHEEIASLSFWHGEHLGVDTFEILLNNDKRKRRALDIVDEGL